MRAVPPLSPRRGPALSPQGAPGTAVTGAAEIAERAADLRARIERAARRAGRDPAAVTLVAASKGQPPDALGAAWRCGVTVFGESRVQEALAKMPLLAPGMEWHFIGPLQTNKVRAAVAAFSVFHSVDRLRLAAALDREGATVSRALPCFVEVNLAAETTKHGFSEADLFAALPRLAELASLRVVGLMAIPPAGRDAAAARPWFRALARLRDRVAATPGWAAFPGLLSMGMSDDFEIAIEEGATHVRIGSALFGPRATVDAGSD